LNLLHYLGEVEVKELGELLTRTVWVEGLGQLNNDLEDKLDIALDKEKFQNLRVIERARF
jgi:hypothetical protein